MMKDNQPYTLEELVKKTDRDFFTAREISGALGVSPELLRLTARQRPELLGFPATLVGNRVKFPRIPFLRHMGVIV